MTFKRIKMDLRNCVPAQKIRLAEIMQVKLSLTSKAQRHIETAQYIAVDDDGGLYTWSQDYVGLSEFFYQQLTHDLLFIHEVVPMTTQNTQAQIPTNGVVVGSVVTLNPNVLPKYMKDKPNFLGVVTEIWDNGDVGIMLRYIKGNLNVSKIFWGGEPVFFTCVPKDDLLLAELKAL